MEPTPKISIHYRKLDELKPADYNPRRLTKEQATALQASIERYGIIDPIIVNTFPGREGVIIGGHQRLEIAKLLAIDEIPCVDVYLDEAREKELNVRLNKNLGEFDWEKLANEFDINMLLDVGFTKAELSASMTEELAEDGFDAQAAYDAISTPNAQRGDVYALGRHRLMCGDSTSAEDVKTLRGGA